MIALKRLAIFALCCLLLTGCAREPLSRTGFAFDTVISITIYGGGSGAALDECFSLINELDALWNRFDPESDLGRLNEAGSAIADPKTLDVIEKAIEYNKDTGGLFDIALANVSDAWGFGTDSPAVPQREEVAYALEKSGMDKVSVSGGAVTLEGGAKLDFGGIAKGHCADLLAEILEKHGVKSAVIDLGGNILCVGQNGGRPFKIGVQKPFGDMNELSGVISVSGKAVVTSGVYQRYFTQNGTLYPHIINPLTGCPCGGEVLSATIVSESAAMADAYGKAVLLLGAEAGLAFAEENPDIEAVIIDEGGGVAYTSGLEGMISLTKN